MQAEQSVLDRIQRRVLNGMDTTLKLMVVIGRRLASGYRMVGGEEEDCNNRGRTK